MKVKWGSIITDGRGTLGGHVYSKNHYGAFARTKVNPLYVNNTYTQQVRLVFESVQQAWHSLSPSDQNLWTLASPDYPKTDFSGTTYFLTGYNLFISVNIPYYTANGTVLSTPPTRDIPTDDLSGVLAIDFSSTGLTWTFNTPPALVNSEVQVFATRPLSPGINYVSTELRLIAIFAGGSPTFYQLKPDWLTKYITPPSTGQRIFVRLRALNFNTGDYGISYTLFGDQP